MNILFISDNVICCNVSSVFDLICYCEKNSKFWEKYNF